MQFAAVKRPPTVAEIEPETAFLAASVNLPQYGFSAISSASGEVSGIVDFGCEESVTKTSVRLPVACS